MNKNTFINLMNNVQIEEIKKQLIENGISKEDIEIALDSRLSDIEELIDVDSILEMI